MKRIFTLLSVAVLSVLFLNVQAEVISQNVAKKVADNLISLDESWHGVNDATIRLVEFDGEPAYYIVEYTHGGWAIVSAQSSATPLIGYNTTGRYVAPEPMQEMLDVSANYIVGMARMDGSVRHKGWQLAMQRKPAADPSTTPSIEPLIPTNLNQSDPYNKYCPPISGKKALVGCVAVATTQAMMVQRYPDQGQGKFTYTDSEGGTGTHTVDFENQYYDWDAIINCDQTKEYDAVARILYQVGVSVKMMYGLTFSGAFTADAYEALHRNFRYDKDKLRLAFRYQYSDDEWLGMVLEDIYLGRAVIYQGAATEDGQGGHCWNLDGWNASTKKVHVNWGWGGYGDGYFDLDNMTDSYQGISFNYHHGAIFGVGTPTTAPYAIKLSTEKFVIGTAAGVALADVIVSCEDPEANLAYEILGPKNIMGKHTVSPYSVQDGKLVASEAVQDVNKFKYMLMTVTNTNTGESFTKEFTISLTKEDGAVDAVMSDAIRVYPSVADNNLTVEVPAVGGEYAVYSVAGVQVLSGNLSQYKTEIGVSSLTAGTYILRYVHNNGVGVKTFIKK